jgi:G:T-mismatch repair DNA endonuclease (very short patch repair protein)
MIIKCIICNSEFVPKKKYRPAKTCSKICKNKLASTITLIQFSNPANVEIQRQRSLEQKTNPEYVEKYKNGMKIRDDRWSAIGYHPRIGKKHKESSKRKIGDANRENFKGMTWEEMYGKEVTERRRMENSIWMATTNETLLKEKRSKLEESLIPYLPEYENNIRISKYTVDFLNEKTKHIIEVYGDYWHCNPKIYPDDYHHHYFNMSAINRRNLDEERVTHLKSLGYTVTIVWESDIKQFIESLV